MMNLPMQPENKALVLDFVEWVARQPRAYAEVMDAWRTSCPRLPVWEDAVELGYVVSRRENGSAEIVRVTAAGVAFLRTERPGRIPA
jgi:hypothetical protein